MNRQNNDNEIKQKGFFLSSKKQPKRSWRGFLSELVFYLLLIVIVLFAYLYSSTQKRPSNFFGYSAMMVLTGSMQDEIPRGSLIITKKVDANEIKVGDNISFFVDEKNTVTHRVIAIMENFAETGSRGFQTQGVNNLHPDTEITYANSVVGRVIFHSLLLGRLFSFLKTDFLFIVGLITISILSTITLWKLLTYRKCFDY